MSGNGAIRRALRVAGVLTIASAAELVAADVVVDMPPPKKKVQPAAMVVAPPSTQPASAIAATAKPAVDVGRLALQRYASARTGPTDTYQHPYSTTRYAGIRYQGYWPGFWWGWGFPGFGCFGTKFVGFVGCTPVSCPNPAPK